jgi:hypothetical protein
MLKEASMLEDERPRLRLLLDHFALIEDVRERWRVGPSAAGGFASGGLRHDRHLRRFRRDRRVGEDDLPFLRRFLPFYHGIPGARWLRILMNRMDRDLFSDCFQSWAAALRPDAPALVAIDGKTSRGSHDRGNGRAAPHLVSAFATREKLVLAQEAVGAASCERETIPLLLERLAAKGRLTGALVSIDAIACNAKTAQAIVDAGADYLLAVKADQPGLMARSSASSTIPARPPSSPRPKRTRAMAASRNAPPASPPASTGSTASALSRRVPLPRPCRHRTIENMGKGQANQCGALLRHVATNAAARTRRGRAQPLDRREQLALGARRHLPPARRKIRNPETDPQTWPSSDTSHSICSEPSTTNEASSFAETRLRETNLYGFNPRQTLLNPDSEPCRAHQGWKEAAALRRCARAPPTGCNISR